MNECLKGQRGILGVKDPKEEESMGHLRPCGFAAGKKNRKICHFNAKACISAYINTNTLYE